MKTKELNVAVLLLERVRTNYKGLFDGNGNVKSFTAREFSKTEAAHELKTIRNLLREVQKELE